MHLQTRTLQDLLPAMAGLLEPAQRQSSHGDADIVVTGVTQDSRQVQPGSVFVAISGGSQDGHRYIPMAIERGAAAIVGMQAPLELDRPYYRVRDSRLALGRLAAAFYAYPAAHLTVIGVTGTDGKTTTATLLYNILLAAHAPCGMVSTVSAYIGSDMIDTGFHTTTPEAPQIQYYLRRMVEAGARYVILEVTSHGLAQGRVEACQFDMAVVTNITHEHLDFHGSYQNYRAAKGKLFSSLSDTPAKDFQPARGAALNHDDASFAYLSGITNVPILGYGMQPGAQVLADGIRQAQGRLQFDVHGIDRAGGRFDFPLSSALEGAFNVSNILAAVTVTRGLMQLDQQAVQSGVAGLAGVPGRMENIAMGQPFTAIVDFAHTPNALSKALQAARQKTTGRVIVVFGSAGLRDREKRRLMAETAAQLADVSVLTAEDPRTESVPVILAEMAAGAAARGGQEGRTFLRIPDRRAAIRQAVRMARPGDLVIACGKGHEQSMCFGQTEYPWDDRTAMRAALAELLGRDGPAMPALPEV